MVSQVVVLSSGPMRLCCRHMQLCSGKTYVNFPKKPYVLHAKCRRSFRRVVQNVATTDPPAPAQATLGRLQGSPPSDDAQARTESKAAKLISRRRRRAIFQNKRDKVAGEELPQLSTRSRSGNAALDTLLRLLFDKRELKVVQLSVALAAAAEAVSLSSLSVQQLGKMCWAVGKLSQRHMDAESALLYHSVLSMVSLRLVRDDAQMWLASGSPKDLALLLYGFARLGFRVSGEGMDTLLASLEGKVEDLSGPSASMLVWSVATMGTSLPQPFVDELLRALEGKLGEFKAEECANLVWGLAGMQADVTQLFISEVLERAGQVSSSFSAGGLTRLVYGLARLDVMVTQEFVDAVMSQVKAVRGSLRPREVATLVWSLGSLEAYVPKEAVSSLLQDLSAKLATFNARDDAMLVHGLAKLDVAVPQPFVDVWVQHAAGRLGTYSAQACANVVWGLASMGVKVPLAFVDAVVAQAGKQWQEFNPHGASNLAWAVAKLGSRIPPQLLPAFLQRVEGMLGRLKPQDHANLAFGLALMQAELPAGFVQGWLEAVGGSLGSFQVVDLSQLAFALSTAPFSDVPHAFLVQLSGAVLDKIEDVDEGAMTPVLCCLLQHEVALPEEQLEEYEVVLESGWFSRKNMDKLVAAMEEHPSASLAELVDVLEGDDDADDEEDEQEDEGDEAREVGTVEEDVDWRQWMQSVDGKLVPRVEAGQ